MLTTEIYCNAIFSKLNLLLTVYIYIFVASLHFNLKLLNKIDVHLSIELVLDCIHICLKLKILCQVYILLFYSVILYHDKIEMKEGSFQRYWVIRKSVMLNTTKATIKILSRRINRYKFTFLLYFFIFDEYHCVSRYMVICAFTVKSNSLALGWYKTILCNAIWIWLKRGGKIKGIILYLRNLNLSRPARLTIFRFLAREIWLLRGCL